jgi:hypothetical protein
VLPKTTTKKQGSSLSPQDNGILYFSIFSYVVLLLGFYTKKLKPLSEIFWALFPLKKFSHCNAQNKKKQERIAM